MAAILNTIIIWLTAALLLLPTSIHARELGFSIGNNHPVTGACKNVNDWKAAYGRMRALDRRMNCFHTYASSDCDGLVRIAEAAVAVGGKVLIGVWATPPDHFGAEKAAVLRAIRGFGTGWIAGVAVGSEDLYRNTQAGQYHINPQDLANQIYDVRGMVRQYDQRILVGHADTWTAWVDPRNDVVTRACDFVLTNGFPYWEGASIQDTLKYNVYQSSLWKTQGRVSSVNPRCKVWVGETGWPSNGDPFGRAWPARGNCQNYANAFWPWLCKKSDMTAFYYTLDDNQQAATNVERTFGVYYINGQRKITWPTNW
ncbi:hypothetical protein TWF696_007439 [Orbilia brochopaga]|uniref:Probable glucan endo-1,3-beta-glucosidase eglC n=1 Tax=Orbilia brochopaga TaxID=3140254 RepID=A0AAV9UNJ2_9PEZI